MGWKCILGDWFGHECNWGVGIILLLALFLCVIYLFCMNNKHHHHKSQQQPYGYYPTRQPQQGYPIGTGTPTYRVSLDDNNGPVMGRYTSTERYSTPSHTIHNIRTSDPDHAAKDIEVHYHSDHNDAQNWSKPTIDNNGDLEIKDAANTMRGHIAVHSDGQKIAHQEVTPS